MFKKRANHGATSPALCHDRGPASNIAASAGNVWRYLASPTKSASQNKRIVKPASLPQAIVGAAFFTLYVATAAPSLVELFDDSLEFQLVAPTFGIAHPTGYPLYVIAGGLWSRFLFPFGNWAWRMNLFSALAAACAVALVFALAQQLARPLNGRPNLWAGLAAALTFGLGPIWWAQATIAEVYALHNLFVIALLYVGFRILDFGERHTLYATWDQGDPPAPYGRVLLFCTIAGLGLAHHRTILLALPALAIYLCWNALWIRRPQRAWAGWLMAFVAPLLLYLWLPLRAAQGVHDLHGSYINTWAGFWHHVLATGYTGFLDANPLAVELSTPGWLALWRQQTGWAAMFLGGLGFVLTVAGGANIDKKSSMQSHQETTEIVQIALWRKLLANPWLYIHLILIANVLFAMIYRVGDAEVFLLPALLCFALFTGGGVALIGHWFRQRTQAAFISQAFCVLVLALGAGGRGPMVNRSQDWTTHDYAVALAKVDFPPGSRVVALEGEATALQYMQRVEGLADNATPIVADDPDQRRQIIARLVEQGAPTYLTRELAGIERQYSFSGEGPLVRVWPRGQAQTGAPMHRAAASFAGGRLQLEGYDLVKLDQAGGPALQIAFFWRPTAPLSQTLKISLRLYHPDGAAVLWPDGKPVQSDHYPLRLVAKTPDWLPGELIRDVHELEIPAAQRDQPLWLHIILYDEQSLVEAGAWQAPVND
jgi:hypothetical protein